MIYMHAIDEPYLIFQWATTDITIHSLPMLYHSGICYEITKQLLLHGCTAAIICGRRENFLQKAAANLSSLTGKPCLYVVCDVRDASACQVKFTLYLFI